MSTTERSRSIGLPPLVEGERLDRATFHARYEAMPPGTRAELIGGVVYMPSPLGFKPGKATPRVAFWLTTYERHTPGIEVLGDATAELDDLGELQPDHMLRILPECGGQTRNEGKYVSG